MKFRLSGKFMIYSSALFLMLITSSSAEDDIDEEDESQVEIIDLDEEDLSDIVDAKFLEMYPTPSPPREFDIEYLLRLGERKKWQMRNYKALENLTHCLYSYHDVVFRLIGYSCYAPLPKDILRWQKEWMLYVDIDAQVENATSKHPYPCSLRTIKESTTPEGVNVVNASECLRILEIEPETDESGTSKQHCAVVLFFSRECQFSVRLAPTFNAIGRAFPDVDIMAVDVSQSSGLYTRYGIVAVPDILLFHRRKPVLRFNYTERSYDNMVIFIQNNTGLEAKTEVQVSAVDYEGPLPTTLMIHTNYLLLFSNAFVIFFAIYMIKQRLGDSILQRFREYMDYARQVWRTGEFYEQVGVHDDNEDGGFG